MINPVGFFRRVSPRGNFVLPLYYGVICQALAIILMWVYHAGLYAFPDFLNYVADFGGYGPLMLTFGWPMKAVMLVVLIVTAPIFAVIAMFFTSATYHICLKLSGGAQNGFETTFRAVCYGSSAQMLGIIPIVGTVVAGVWTLILCVIGIKELHKTTYFKAILAVMLPVFLCCGFVVLVVVGLFGAIIGAWMGGISA